MTAKKTVKVTKVAEKISAPVAKKAVAKPAPAAAKKATPVVKVAKPMKATVTLGNPGKKKVDHAAKAEDKIAELRTGVSALYGR